MPTNPKPVPVSELRKWLPERKPDSHKGDFGHVLIVAGSRGMSGAGVLAASAALRSGAGLATLAVPKSIQPVVAGMLPEMLTIGLPETEGGFIAAATASELETYHQERRYTILGIGPGIGGHTETGRAVPAILQALKIPAVIDADALNHLASLSPETVRELVEVRGAPCIFTPHPGEAARLMRFKTEQIQADRPIAAHHLAEEFRVCCLLKGYNTIISDGRRAAVNPTGNPGLAKGGTGDVLTGIVTALWAQQIASKSLEAGTGFKAAVLGAYLHGLAADIGVKANSVYSLLASDVIESLPQAFRKLLA